MIHKHRFSSLIFLVFLLFSCESKEEIKFDSNKWKNWEETEKSQFLRWDMRNDLIKNHKIKGLSEKELIEILGEPDVKTKDVFRYNLGPTRKGIDYGTFILKFKNKTIVNYEIVHG